MTPEDILLVVRGVWTDDDVFERDRVSRVPISTAKQGMSLPFPTGVGGAPGGFVSLAGLLKLPLPPVHCVLLGLPIGALFLPLPFLPE